MPNIFIINLVRVFSGNVCRGEFFIFLIMLPLEKFEKDLKRSIRRLNKAIKYAEKQQDLNLTSVATPEEIEQLKEANERLKKIYWDAHYIELFYM